MTQAFQAKNKTLLNERVLTKSIKFLFDLINNPQTRLTTISIRHKAGAPMVERERGMQPDVPVTF